MSVTGLGKGDISLFGTLSSILAFIAKMVKKRAVFGVRRAVFPLREGLKKTDYLVTLIQRVGEYIVEITTS